MFVTMLLILISFVVVILGQFFQQKWKYRSLSHIRSPPMYPLLGSALEFGMNPVEQLKDLCRLTRLYGPISKFSVGPLYYYLLLADPDVTEFIMSSPRFLTKSPDYDLLRPWIGNGLLTSTGTLWQKRRKAITPTFHFKILDAFIPIFNRAGNILIKQLSKEEGHDFDVYPYITSYTLDNICETAMGTNINAQENKDHQYVRAVKFVGAVFMNRTLSAWKQFDCLFKYASEYNEYMKCLGIIHGFTKDVIQKRKEELRKNANKIKNNENDDDVDVGMKKKQVFLDLLLNSTIDGKPLSDQDISEEVDTFMFEGHDTTASAIAFGLYELSKAPHIQKKVTEELNNIFNDDPKREATILDLNNMKYLEAVIKETLRLYPSVPIFGRRLQEDATFKGTTYPKGLIIGFFVYQMHRRENLFKNADKFDPDRFLGENILGLHPFSYVPFSAGPRNCIGQKFAMYEMKSALSKIVRHFQILQADPKFEVVLSTEAILKSATGVKIKLKKRACIFKKNNWCVK